MLPAASSASPVATSLPFPVSVANSTVFPAASSFFTKTSLSAMALSTLLPMLKVRLPAI